MERDPKSLPHILQNKNIASKLEKLIAAGILRVGWCFVVGKFIYIYKKIIDNLVKVSEKDYQESNKNNDRSLIIIVKYVVRSCLPFWLLIVVTLLSICRNYCLSIDHEMSMNDFQEGNLNNDQNMVPKSW